MEPQKSKRKRGVMLTPEAWQKIQRARLELEFQENFGEKFTLEELSKRTGLTTITLARVMTREEAVDKKTLILLFQAFHLELTRNDYLQPEATRFERLGGATGARYRHDWGEATDVTVFYGRTEELSRLHQWVLDEHCRLVLLLGLGGIGKTSLATKLAEQVRDRFECIFWRSLYNAPPLKDILANFIHVCLCRIQ
jgi:transcriptional regulator with XRE-family HTH domain